MRNVRPWPWSRTSTWRRSRSMPMTSCWMRTSMRLRSRNSRGVRATSASSGSTSPADQVGDAAGRVAGPGALLEGHDLEVGVAAVGRWWPRSSRRRRHRSPPAAQPWWARLSPRPVPPAPARARRAALAAARLGAMAVRKDCRHYSTRSTDGGRRRAAVPGRRRRAGPVRLPGGLPVLRAALGQQRRLGALRGDRRRRPLGRVTCRRRGHPRPEAARSARSDRRRPSGPGPRRHPAARAAASVSRST